MHSHDITSSIPFDSTEKESKYTGEVEEDRDNSLKKLEKSEDSMQVSPEVNPIEELPVNKDAENVKMSLPDNHRTTQKDSIEYTPTKTILIAGELYDWLYATAPPAFRVTANEIMFTLNDGVKIKLIDYAAAETTVAEEETPNLDWYKDNKVNGAVITYRNEEDSLNIALHEVSELKKSICPGCLMLAKMTTDPENRQQVTLYHYMNENDGIFEFENFSISEWGAVTSVFQKIVDGSKHLNFADWVNSDCISNEITINFDQYFIRKSLYNLFASNTDPEKLVREMMEDLKKFSMRHSVHIPKKSAVDILHSLLSSTQRSRYAKFSVVRTNEPFRREPSSIKPPKIKEYVIQVERGRNCGVQPIIFTAKAKHVENSVLCDLLDCEKQKAVLESKISKSENDGQRQTSYDTIRNMCHKLFIFGVPWRNYAMDCAEVHNINIEDDATKVSSSNKRKRANSVSSAESATYRCSTCTSRNSMFDDCGCSDCSLCSNRSEISMGCQLAKMTTVPPLRENISTQTYVERLMVDLVIWCPDVDLCRNLSATFGLVHIDEILINFKNKKNNSKPSKKAFYSFKTPHIESCIVNWWDEILRRQPGYRKTFRMVQTRYCEYLDAGCHNVAITSCRDVISNVTANSYAAIFVDKDDLLYCNFEMFSYIAVLPKGNPFLSAVAELANIIDNFLMYEASVPLQVRYNKKTYEVKVSLICLIPLYILRALCSVKWIDETKVYFEETGLKPL